MNQFFIFNVFLPRYYAYKLVCKSDQNHCIVFIAFKCKYYYEFIVININYYFKKFIHYLKFKINNVRFMYDKLLSVVWSICKLPITIIKRGSGESRFSIIIRRLGYVVEDSTHDVLDG